MGDPAFDLAHFCAYLDLRAGARSALLRRAFLDEYATTAYGHSTRASLPTPERLALFRAYAWLKIAKQLVKGTGPHRLSDGQRRTSTVADALVKGLQCLDK